MNKTKEKEKEKEKKKNKMKHHKHEKYKKNTKKKQHKNKFRNNNKMRCINRKRFGRYIRIKQESQRNETAKTINQDKEKTKTKLTESIVSVLFTEQHMNNSNIALTNMKGNQNERKRNTHKYEQRMKGMQRA